MTGGAGSWGTAFAQEVLTHHHPARLTLYSRGEHRQVEAAALLTPLPAGRKLRMRLGDIRDYARLRWALEDHEVVIHAAALKVIAHGLSNPSEMAATNVHGTENVLRAAVEAGAQRVLFISSDKVVNPTTFYGHTKALAEAMTSAWNTMSFPRGTWCSSVRWGNVLGSRGSVVHVWRRQVRENAPLTVVPGMTRFLLTLEQAVAVVLRTLGAMRAGETVVPHLPACRIEDLARAVALAERPDVAEWPVELIPALPTEKVHEELVSADEAARGVEVEEDTVIEPALLAWPRPAWEGEKAQPRRSDEVARLSVDVLRQRVQEIQ